MLGCFKNENIMDNGSILTSKKWKRGLTDLNPSSNPKGKTIYYAVKDCEKDDTLKFDSNSLTISENDNKCGEKEIISVHYTIDREKKEITINNQTYKIAEETENQIKYYSVISSSTGYDFLIYLFQ